MDTMSDFGVMGRRDQYDVLFHFLLHGLEFTDLESTVLKDLSLLLFLDWGTHYFLYHSFLHCWGLLSNVNF